MKLKIGMKDMWNFTHAMYFNDVLFIVPIFFWLRFRRNGKRHFCTKKSIFHMYM